MWFLFILISLVQTESPEAYENAIQKTFEQRILVQQIVKEYAFIISGVYHKNNRKSFTESLSRFERNLQLLINGSTNKNIPAPPIYEMIEQLEKISYHWRKFKTLFTDSKFGLILNYQEKIDANLKLVTEGYLAQTRKEEMTLSDSEFNILKSFDHKYISESLIKEVTLFMLDEGNRSNALDTKDDFQDCIQFILDMDDESDPNYTVIDDVKSLWKTMDITLINVLNDGDKNKIHLMTLHKTQTLIIKRIDRYKEIQNN